MHLHTLNTWRSSGFFNQEIFHLKEFMAGITYRPEMSKKKLRTKVEMGTMLPE